MLKSNGFWPRSPVGLDRLSALIACRPRSPVGLDRLSA